MCAHTQTSFNQSVGCWWHVQAITFIALEGVTLKLAHTLDSLVRVSRRDIWGHLVTYSDWEAHSPTVNTQHKAWDNQALHCNQSINTQLTGKHHRWCFCIHQYAYQHHHVLSKPELQVTHSRGHTTQHQHAHYNGTCTTSCKTSQHTWQSHCTSLTPCTSHSANSGTFKSLSKVLFTFPSWYLLAIGLAPVLSLRWNLPPIWRSNHKERDSLKVHCMQGNCMWQMGLSPSMALFPKRLPHPNPAGNTSQDNNSKCKRLISMVSTTLFIRHYFGSPV